MTVAADYFLPAIFDLTQSSVQGIQTSQTNPRVVLDSTGLYATTAGSSGNKRFWLPANDFIAGLHLPESWLETSTAFAFTRRADDQPVAGIHNHHTLTDPGTGGATGGVSRTELMTNGAGGGIATGLLDEGEFKVTAPPGNSGSSLRFSNRLRNVPEPFIDHPGVPPGILEVFFSDDINGWTTILDGHGASDFLKGENLLFHLSGQVGTTFNSWVGWNVTFPHQCKRGCLVIMQNTGYVNAGPANTAWNLLLNGVTIGSQVFYFNTAGQHMTLPLLVGWYGGAIGPGVATLQTVNPSSPLAVDGNDSCAAIVLGF